ncbi:class I SAM-dependent methyltransferase [Sphingobium subterraneum]|uniref:Phospholipid N-methyltransferase n=1 Tax=Sphingobium subterraneum TaxID=627688 RepID=A0A841J0I1_9SPHN|nr:methyltransferase domain-containing protein [Sphingobium subterraneum]MBB6124719.1 phospholipid N-methyltransferase [Sphingobium subterraneum]
MKSRDNMTARDTYRVQPTLAVTGQSFVPRPLREAAAFFREFLRAPAMVGSIIPTAGGVVDAMLRPVDWSRTRLFVEYGPGVGTFTREILKHLPGDAMLIAIDTSPHFVAHLKANILDHRLRVVHGSAIDVETIIRAQGEEHADYILSGLPFSTLPDGVGPSIAQATHAALRPGGAFLVYQYSGFVRRLLQPHFTRIDEETNWLNIPPCRTFWAWKGAVSVPPGGAEVEAPGHGVVEHRDEKIADPAF